MELSDDPVESAWQLAGIAPLTQLDQVALLRSTTMRELLMRLIDLTLGAGEVLTTPWTVEDELDAEIARALREAGATDERTRDARSADGPTGDGPDGDGPDGDDADDDDDESDDHPRGTST